MASLGGVVAHAAHSHRRPNHRPKNACCRNHNETVALICWVNALAHLLLAEPSPCGGTSFQRSPQLTTWYQAVFVFVWYRRPPHGPPKVLLFKAKGTDGHCQTNLTSHWLALNFYEWHHKTIYVLQDFAHLQNLMLDLISQPTPPTSPTPKPWSVYIK